MLNREGVSHSANGGWQKAVRSQIVVLRLRSRPPGAHSARPIRTRHFIHWMDRPQRGNPQSPISFHRGCEGPMLCPEFPSPGPRFASPWVFCGHSSAPLCGFATDYKPRTTNEVVEQNGRLGPSTDPVSRTDFSEPEELVVLATGQHSLMETVGRGHRRPNRREKIRAGDEFPIGQGRIPKQPHPARRAGNEKGRQTVGQISRGRKAQRVPPQLGLQP